MTAYLKLKHPVQRQAISLQVLELLRRSINEYRAVFCIHCLMDLGSLTVNNIVHFSLFHRFMGMLLLYSMGCCCIRHEIYRLKTAAVLLVNVILQYTQVYAYVRVKKTNLKFLSLITIRQLSSGLFLKQHKCPLTLCLLSYVVFAIYDS